MTNGPKCSGVMRRMVARDPSESHRAATPLELLYDLCFVIAVAQAAAGLHHDVSHGHAAHGVIGFAFVFFAIWWAWMGFAWFASAFDTDDGPYRLKVLIQLIGVLVLAAGVPRAFEHTDFGLVTLGYVIMRIGLVAQWLRAARQAPEYRTTALRYTTSIIVCQVGWVALLALPTEYYMFAAAGLIPLELAGPAWAERARPTTWHPHHIAERYGLLTIIVIGESVLAGTVAVQTSLDAGTDLGALLPVILAAPIIVFAMWWLYFERPHHEMLDTTRAAFAWGYGHYAIFATAAAVGAGLSVAVDHAAHEAHISSWQAGLALAIPVAAYLLSLWWVTIRPCGPGARCSATIIGCALLVLGAAFVPASPLVIAGLLAITTFVIARGDARSREVSCEP